MQATANILEKTTAQANAGQNSPCSGLLHLTAPPSSQLHEQCPVAGSNHCLHPQQLEPFFAAGPVPSLMHWPLGHPCYLLVSCQPTSPGTPPHPTRTLTRRTSCSHEHRPPPVQAPKSTAKFDGTPSCHVLHAFQDVHAHHDPLLASLSGSGVHLHSPLEVDSLWDVALIKPGLSQGFFYLFSFCVCLYCSLLESCSKMRSLPPG